MRTTGTFTNPRRRNSRILVGTLVASFALALPGLSIAGASARTPSKSTAAPETPTITYPLTGVSAGSGGLVFSVQDGFFTKYGLSVTVPSSSEGPVKDGIAAGTFPIGQ
jgi:hypothetical protein